MALVELTRVGSVAVLELRDGKVNALSNALMEQLAATLSSLASENDVGAIVIRGSNKAFSAGVDIKELRNLDFVSGFTGDFLRPLADMIQNLRVPVIAAVNGYALGGGFELAMLCDIIYAGESATFGQPEVKIGTIPGGGGTQRLVRAIGKAKAMDLILTGKSISAQEAFAWGVVSQVVPDERLFDFAIDTAKQISSYSRPVVLMAKEAINTAEETPLSQGLLFERRLYHATLGLKDSKEGMDAFIEKRQPAFRNC